MPIAFLGSALRMVFADANCVLTFFMSRTLCLDLVEGFLGFAVRLFFFTAMISPVAYKHQLGSMIILDFVEERASIVHGYLLLPNYIHIPTITTPYHPYSLTSLCKTLFIPALTVMLLLNNSSRNRMHVKCFVVFRSEHGHTYGTPDMWHRGQIITCARIGRRYMLRRAVAVPIDICLRFYPHTSGLLLVFLSYYEHLPGRTETTILQCDKIHAGG